MNRRHFISSLSATGLSAAVAGTTLAAETGVPATTNSPPQPAAPTQRDAPAVYAPTPDGATILWPATGYCAGWVEYGEAGSPPPGNFARNDGLGFVPHESRVLRVRLQGLKPGQIYWFRTHTRPVVVRDYATAEIKVATSKTYSTACGLRAADRSARNRRAGACRPGATAFRRAGSACAACPGRARSLSR